MPRKNRVHYRHAFYHVMLRGNNRQCIFHHDIDYLNFIDCLKSASTLYSSHVHLYCLMPNHIHLVIEVTDIPLSKLMQRIGTIYAQKHNKRYNKIGHVFQGRFKAKLIQDDQYLLELCYYIHMNPVKAGLCQAPDGYRWSSHFEYMRHGNQPLQTFVTTEHITNLLADFRSTYERFISQYKSNDNSSTYCAFDQDGHLVIKDDVLVKMQNKPSLALENITIDTIIKIVCSHLNVSQDDLSSGSQIRNVTLARSMIAYFSHYHALYTLNDVAALFCLQRNSLSKTLHRHLNLAQSNKRISATLKALEGKLSRPDLDRCM